MSLASYQTALPTNHACVPSVLRSRYGTRTRNLRLLLPSPLTIRMVSGVPVTVSDGTLPLELTGSSTADCGDRWRPDSQLAPGRTAIRRPCSPTTTVIFGAGRPFPALSLRSYSCAPGFSLQPSPMSLGRSRQRGLQSGRRQLCRPVLPDSQPTTGLAPLHLSAGASLNQLRGFVSIRGPFSGGGSLSPYARLTLRRCPGALHFVPVRSS